MIFEQVVEERIDGTADVDAFVSFEYYGSTAGVMAIETSVITEGEESHEIPDIILRVVDGEVYEVKRTTPPHQQAY